MPIKVKAAGAWQTAAAKVKVAGTWKAAYYWTKVSGTWRRGARDFDLATGNVYPGGIAWAVAYFYVVDTRDDKVYVYDADGNYQSNRDFDFATGNNFTRGIAWGDGPYLYMVDYDSVRCLSTTPTGTTSQPATSTSPPATATPMA